MNDKLTARVERLASASLSRCGFTAGFSGKVAAPLVVGVSGGPDSTALLYCLYRIREAWGLQLHVAHLNHDFRGEEADADAEFVTELAGELHLPVTVEKRDPIAYQRERGISSFEQGARELRYAFLARVAASVGASAVAVAHTADDLAETVLLHILRGTGLHGLRGMTEQAPWPWPLNLPQLRLLRPFLEATKAETVAYCDSLGRSFRVDTGNALPRFTRNRVRQSLLPLLAEEYNPRIRESLVRLARTASLELDFLEKETDAAWTRVLSDGEEAGPEVADAKEADSGFVSLHRQALTQLHPALQRMVLRRAYTMVSGDARRLRESHLRAMAEAAGRRSSGQTLQLPGGWRFHVTYDVLRLTKNPALDCPYPPLIGLYPVSLPQSRGEVAVTRLEGWEISMQRVATPDVERLAQAPPWAAYLGLEALDRGLQIRSRRPGDRFQPLGMAHQKKLQDFYTDARIPESWRDRVPLLITDRGIAWIVGHRIAEWARVSSQAGEDGQVYFVTFQLV